MASTQAKTQELVTSDLLHNRNCFNYLRNLKISDLVLDKLPREMAALLISLKDKEKADYNPTVPYGDLYTQFFDYVEEHIASIYNSQRSVLDLEHARLTQHMETFPEGTRLNTIQKLYLRGIGSLERIKSISAGGPESVNYWQLRERKAEALQQEIDALDDFIISLYDNDNEILEDTFASIREITLAQAPILDSIESSIAERVSDKGIRVNLHSQTPAQAGSAYGRFTAMIADDFKPQHTTSLSTVRKYRSNEGSSVREYRFGTQGQRHQGDARVSPLFKQFLDIQQLKLADDRSGSITHLYFNNLGRDRTDAEGLKEKALTEQLEALESEHSNVGVITLPADKGLMHQNDYKNTKPRHDYQIVRADFLQIALEAPGLEREIQDFHISPKIRKKIFCDARGVYTPEIEKAQLEALLDKSFEALGLDNMVQLSSAQRQAVWFHFIKFELTNHIIETLQPDSINFSCKDAIDRGGVSSAYYNLIKSFEPEKTPMGREEFERALHAAPTMVKGRGMNHHVRVIWNAVDAYVMNNYGQLANNPEKSWIIEWRDFNCPHHRVNGLLRERVQQLKSELEQANQAHIPEAQKVLITKGIEILNAIEKQTTLGASGKRLLLEAATRTALIALHPEQANTARYEKVMGELTINYPALTVLRGLMKTFVGTVVRLFTAGKQQELFNSGVATMTSGLNALSRKDMQTAMKEQLHSLKSMQTSQNVKEEGNVETLSEEDSQPRNS